MFSQGPWRCRGLFYLVLFGGELYKGFDGGLAVDFCLADSVVSGVKDISVVGGIIFHFDRLGDWGAGFIAVFHSWDRFTAVDFGEWNIHFTSFGEVAVSASAEHFLLCQERPGAVFEKLAEGDHEDI